MGYTCWKTEKAFFRPGGATAGATANNRNAKPRKQIAADVTVSRHHPTAALQNVVLATRPPTRKHK